MKGQPIWALILCGGLTAMLAGCETETIPNSCIFSMEEGEQVSLFEKDCSISLYTVDDLTIESKEQDSAYLLTFKKGEKEISSKLNQKLYLTLQMYQSDSNYIFVMNNGGQTYGENLLIVDKDGNSVLEVYETDSIRIDVDSFTVNEHEIKQTMWGACSEYEDVDAIAYRTNTYDLNTLERLDSVEVPISEVCY